MPYKKIKTDDPESVPQSPLNFSGFEEDLQIFPKDKCNNFDSISEINHYEMELNDINSEVSADIDKLDFLLDQ
jgi:hypothetical protein